MSSPHEQEQTQTTRSDDTERRVPPQQASEQHIGHDQVRRQQAPDGSSFARTDEHGEHHPSPHDTDLSSEAVHAAPGEHGAHAGHDAHGAAGAHAAHAGHTGHEGHADHAAIFARRFWISLILSIPVVIFSEMMQDLLGYTAPEFPGSDWIAPVFGTIVFIYGGRVFLEGGWDEIKQRQPGMMLLISLAIVVAFVASLATTFGFFDLDFWWELALLITIMLLGHWLEMRALGQAQSAVTALAELLPDEAERVHPDGSIERVPLSELAPGDVVLVRPGGSVPADGVIREGHADLDESLLTGESRPVSKGPGDPVAAGTVVAGSALRIEITAVGEATALGGIQRLVEEAQSSRSRAQALADRFAGWLFYIAVAAGIITFLAWTGLGETDEAVTRTVTVLVISCPHALGLAIPLVIALSTSLSARQGILVRDRLALERMRTIDTVLFDKTGTLTKGEHIVTDLAVARGEDENRVLALAAAAEADSEHPLARAIVRAADERGLVRPSTTNFVAVPGRGVQATVDGSTVMVGGPALLHDQQATPPPEIRERTEEWEKRGASVLHVLSDGKVIGALALEDELRPESREAVKLLQDEGITVMMITGDARQVAETIARDLGINEVLAEVLPEDKDKKVIELQQRGQRVAMVGDGVNDAPALARADVGIAIGAGTDVAIESAGIILASSDPRGVVSVLRLSQESYRKMVQNLAWAVGYNVIAIPLAAGVLAPVGFVLPPAAGAILMSLSTIIVALNAQLLRGVNLRPWTTA